MNCKHERYQSRTYLTSINALRAMASKRSDVCWMGKVIRKCEDCGADIEYANVVPVKTVDEYLSGV